MMMNRDITKLNLYHELLANRYLLSVLLTNVMAMNSYWAEIYSEFKKEERKKETKEKVSHTLLKERKEKKKEERTMSLLEKKVEFNSFTLSTNKLDALLREYDHDVVMDAVVVLDKLIGINGKSYKDIPRKLEELCKQLAQRERIIETLDATARGLREIDVEQIEDETMAKKYIHAVPKYLRNVDKGCQYLVEKFGLDIERVPNIG